MAEEVSDVRLLYFDDCPNWRVAEARLKDALAGIGADPNAPTGLTCRIYRTDTGVQPAPTVEQLHAVLVR